jgi:hypothetical protein
MGGMAAGSGSGRHKSSQKAVLGHLHRQRSFREPAFLPGAGQ